MRGFRLLLPPEDRDPLRVMFIIASMPIGGAERLLAELVRGLDRKRFWPELCCLRGADTLGESLAASMPVFAHFADHSYDLFAIGPLARLLRDRRVDAVVTVGTGGDNMLWGRLAAALADVPVVCSALHAAATDTSARLEWIHRLLTPLTDAFIALTETHRAQLIQQEHIPAPRVHVIRSGINLQTFHRRELDPRLRASLGLWPDSPTLGVVAQLRPEKNLGMFLEVARRVRAHRRDVQFVLVGEGPAGAALKERAVALRMADHVHFLGQRNDVADLLSLFDVFLLTSNEENCPPAILEAMACELPVVATRIGSIPEMISEGDTGYIVARGDVESATEQVLGLLANPKRAALFGRRGRRRVLAGWALPVMIQQYQDLLTALYRRKCAQPVRAQPTMAEAVQAIC